MEIDGKVASVRRVRKLDALQGMRASGVACTGDLTCGSRGVESHVERPCPTGGDASSLSILPYFVTLSPHRQSPVCVVTMATPWRGEGGGAYTKVSDRARSFLQRRVH